jgi:hypothetical protein
MDSLSDNLEIKTPKTLDEWVLKNHLTLGQTLFLISDGKGLRVSGEKKVFRPARIRRHSLTTG